MNFIKVCIIFLLLSGCSTIKEEVVTKIEKPDIVNVDLQIVKLYAKENLDTGKLMDDLNIDLNNGLDVVSSLNKYGRVFIDTKLNILTKDRKDFEFEVGNTLAYVSGFKNNEIVVGNYNIGVKGSIRVTNLDLDRYIVDYKLESSILHKMIENPSNKILLTPLIKKKIFNQATILELKKIGAVAINNTDANQYEIIVVGIKNQ